MRLRSDAPIRAPSRPTAFDMAIVALPCPFQGRLKLDEVTGGAPYGATTITAGDGSRRQAGCPIGTAERRQAMSTFAADRFKDEVILAARILLVVVFLVFGWAKVTDYSETVSYMVQTGAPLPPVAALVAIVVELFVSIAVVLGFMTRPLAIVLALYALATALIGHHFWTMTGAVQYDMEIHFYKNISIMGGFFLLYVTGAGRYSVDAMLGVERSGRPLRSV